MKADKRHFIASIFMILSLVLLTGFLTLFLIKSYKKEKENLQKEVGYLFINSVRNIEGGILNNLILKRDSSSNEFIRFPRFRKDSLKIKSIIKLDDNKISESESNIRIEVKRDEKFTGINQVEGAVAMFIAMGHDSTQLYDSSSTGKVSNEFLKELQSGFQKNMESANLPVKYSIIKTHQDNHQVEQETPSGSYTDISTGDRYEVLLDQFSFEIFKRMFPEFIFSILLFFSVILAFYMVNKSLASEKLLLNLKNDFIQNITHELKTPISTVSVAIEALHDDNISNETHKKTEYLDIAKNELKRLSLLVDKVLNISQFENSIPQTRYSSLDLKEQIENIASTLKLQLEKLNAVLRLEFNGVNFKIKGDIQQLDVVLYNLIDNALKYNTSLKPEIVIQLESSEDNINLYIVDNGIGIPAEHKNRIFDKFYRVPHGNIHNIKGHGLGLSFVSQVVSEMGAEIKIEDNHPSGSIFIITFPIDNTI